MKNEIKKRSFGILTIATNIYIDYWMSMATSVEDSLEDDDFVISYVFTDQVDLANDFASKLRKLRVVVTRIEPYGWPDATLLRYEIFSKHSHLFTTDCLMYLDADMLICKNFINFFDLQCQGSDVIGVLHPGYWRPSRKVIFYLNNPKMIIGDVRQFFKIGGIGSWETNHKSLAFVKRRLRRQYYCGGVWLGQTHSVLQMINVLSKRVNMDLRNGIIAKWHDESHLNYWFANNPHQTLGPEFCFVKEYVYLQSLEPVIIAVTKEKLTR